MKSDPDMGLDRRPDIFEPPSHGPDFWRRVSLQLEAAGAPESAPRANRRRWLRPAVAVAAAAAACLLLALGLAGLPGTTELGPPPAGAVGRLLAQVDAGLARVQTAQGMMVTADASGRQSRGAFAITSSGDAYADAALVVPRRVVLEQRRTYRQDLADMRAGRQPWNGRQLRTDRSILVRQEWAGDAATQVSTSRAWYVDAFTGRSAGIGYARSINSDGRFDGLPEPGALDPANVWGLSSAVRTAIASSPDRVTLSETVYEGRPATRATVDVAGRRWVATIDRRYGIVLAFGPVGGPAAQRPYRAFRLTGLRVNETVPRSRFTVAPVFSLDTAFRRIPLGWHDPRPYTDDSDSSTVAVAQAAAAGTRVLLPSGLPAGFRLWPMATAYQTSVTFWYVQGIGSVELRESDREQYPTPDRATWMDASTGAPAMSRRLVSQTRGGALDGWPMIMTVPRLDEPGTADWHNAGIDGGSDTTQVSLRGVLTRGQYLAMISSLRPADGWHLLDRPSYQYGRVLLAVVIGLVVTAVAIEVAATMLARRGRRTRRGLRMPEALALAGCVALAVSLWLPWYHLESAAHHVDYVLRGGSIRFVVAALACASGAAIVALIRAAMGGWRLPAREPVLLAVFGLFALALLVDVRLVQPDQARFLLGDLLGGTAIRPTPWLGMLVGFAGVALILLAAILSREPRTSGTSA